MFTCYFYNMRLWNKFYRLQRFNLYCFHQSYVYIDIFYCISDNHDTERDDVGQYILSENEVKKIPLMKCELILPGSFASVYRCENKVFGVKRAVKRVSYIGDQKLVHVLYNEIKLLRKLTHKHIVKYYDMLQDKESVSIIMGYLARGSIYLQIKTGGALYEESVRKYCGQILEGLAYLHEEGIVHRDLKCSNILLDNSNNCKLSDFGISKDGVQALSGCKTDCGSPYWMSPECITCMVYGWKADIWSFGCTVLEMLNRDPPYHEFSVYAALYKIVQEGIIPSFPPSTSEHCMVFT